MRGRFVMLWLLAAAAAAYGEPAAATPPYEVVRDHVDIAVENDSSYVETREESYRVLDASGVKLLQERKLGYTQGFETLEILAAYTLKADGRRIDVPASSILSGFGQTSQRGFYDNHVVSLFYPNLEAGDRIVLSTRHKQLTPWFPGFFDFQAVFSRTIATHDAVYHLTAPASMKLNIDAGGLTGGPDGEDGGRKHWTWRFDNAAPDVLENDAVSENDFAPHLGLSTFADYGDVARAYRERAKNRAAVTPAISALADTLTKGVADKREQARILYEWVSTHIAYVAIELGSGGFTPHPAQYVLDNLFGDCKDHVVLLEALLAAKGIDSTTALIKIGENAYKLPAAASPHAFDHVVNYLPGFDLFVDSTAGLAPFGVLPYSDVGKPVVLAASGKEMHTPTPASSASTVKTESTVELKADGSAEGHSTITANGAYGVHLRAFIRSIDAGKENELFRELMGPGADGKLDRGTPLQLKDPYVVKADYKLPNVVSFPGPGALPFSLSFRPYYFTELIAGSLPPARNSEYVCPSLTAEEKVTLTLPAGVKLLSIPDSQELKAAEIRLITDYQRKDPRTLVETITLKIDHPHAQCSAEYYSGVRDALRRMAALLRQQVVYRGPAAGGE
jgi:transglutaminase-like putative cysteine protease